jgi:hypothetical protein
LRTSGAVGFSPPRRSGGSSPVLRRAEAHRSTYWLIVHSGPEDEVLELIGYAQALRELHPIDHILVATRCNVPLPAGFTRIDAYPATHLFADAAKIISAAGFNVMLDTEPWRAKHHPMPFARAYDDQFRRAARRR